jgi:hypothetical protein
VVILCHSIPLHVCQTIAAVIQQNWPGTRLLQVSAVREWEELECARGIEVCSPEPERLIERTSMLLNHRNCDSVRPVIQKPSDRTITVH